MKKLTALLALFCSLSLLAAENMLQFDSPEQEKSYHQLTQQLRCPQCQNNNIADSNATIAVDMRQKVLALLKQGNSEQQVVNYMVERYGHFVTYKPPITATTLILWIAPIALMILGIILVFRRSPKPNSPIGANGRLQLDQNQQQRLATLLEDKEK